MKTFTFGRQRRHLIGAALAVALAPLGASAQGSYPERPVTTQSIKYTIVDKLSAAVKEVVAIPDVREKLIAQGATPRGGTPAELQAVIDTDKERYARVIKARNVRVE